MPRTSLAMASRSALRSGCELSFSCSSTAASLENSWSRELFERAALPGVLGEPAGSAAAGAEAACRGEGCGVERAVASGGLLATGVTRCCCCDAAPLSFAPFSFSFSFSLASLALEEEPPMQALADGQRFGEIQATARCLARRASWERVRSTSSGECKFDLRRGSAQIHCRCGTSARRIGWPRARLTTGHASDAGPACPVRRAVPGVAQ